MVKFLICAFIFCAYSAPVFAGGEYEFCVSSNVRPGRVHVNGRPVDFGKEWYKVRVGQTFCNYTGATQCSVQDYSPEKCGNLISETIEYYSANGSQIKEIFSGNIVTMGQTVTEIVIGVPIKTIQEVTKGAEKAVKGLGKVIKKLF